MYEGVDTVVLHNELAYEDVLPVGWRGLSKPLDMTAVSALTERNIRTLLVCATIEEQGPVEKAEDKSLHSADLLRLEVKMNLVLEVLGQLLAAQQPRPRLASVRFNALGANWRTPTPPKVGDQGLLDIYLRECLAQPLTLIANVTHVSAEGMVKVAFTPPGEATADLIEKLAFRRHRRHVAGVRQPRRSPGETGITRILG
ncbi:MAG: PilZ domain-containing protein [Proteobacteria bacterium]|jgi:Atypical PilZ domain, cyclic di-GMP receptor|nr:PilZ domain-containing protein [Pseudomonadota bacterium]MBK9251559.1 PilZ domain-containing protein [Pseudomonadota bacterium]